MPSRRLRWRTTRPQAPRGRLHSACGLDRTGSYGDSAVRGVGVTDSAVREGGVPIRFQEGRGELGGIEYAEIFALFTDAHEADRDRSEERRVGKACRAGWSP